MQGKARQGNGGGEDIAMKGQRKERKEKAR